jgi:GGDEF domain-containing protein
LQLSALALNVSPSIGIATWQEGDATAEVLLQLADEAMSRAMRDQSGYAFSDERALLWAQWSESALGSFGR